MSWLSYGAFIVAALVTAAATYGQTAALGFSMEAVVEWIVKTVVGGVVLGAIFTWGMKKLGQKDK